MCDLRALGLEKPTNRGKVRFTGSPAPRASSAASDLVKEKLMEDARVVRVAKRRNPLAVFLAIVFGVIGICGVLSGSIGAAMMWSAIAAALMFVKEDAER
jgi:hypothetical protein